MRDAVGDRSPGPHEANLCYVQAKCAEAQAIEHGITSTAGVVSSAAFVMVAVFSIFAMLSMIEFKQMGVGLASAILIDATIVRAIILPAAMRLLGERNWWLPRPLARSRREDIGGDVPRISAS